MWQASPGQAVPFREVQRHSLCGQALRTLVSPSCDLRPGLRQGGGGARFLMT